MLNVFKKNTRKGFDKAKYTGEWDKFKEFLGTNVLTRYNTVYANAILEESDRELPVKKLKVYQRYAGFRN